LDNSTHYFYWDWDGPHPHDLEPVLVIDNENNNPAKLVFSRFHWKYGTMWVNAVIVNSRPNITFLTDRHVPIAQSKSYVIDIMQIIETKMAKRETFFHSLAFRAILMNPSSYFKGETHNYVHLIVKASILEKFEFSYDRLNCILIIGSKIEDLSEEIVEKLEGLKSFRSTYSTNAWKALPTKNKQPNATTKE